MPRRCRHHSMDARTRQAQGESASLLPPATATREHATDHVNSPGVPGAGDPQTWKPWWLFFSPFCSTVNTRRVSGAPGGPMSQQQPDMRLVTEEQLLASWCAALRFCHSGTPAFVDLAFHCCTKSISICPFPLLQHHCTSQCHLPSKGVGCLAHNI